MIDWSLIEKLMKSFPNSFINHNGEFIAHGEANEYFILKSCETRLEVNCKILEWLSRAACKSQPFTKRKNEIFHAFMLHGINQFLGTDFTVEDMEKIYTNLGNSVDHKKTIRFVASGYDMAVLEAQEGKR